MKSRWTTVVLSLALAAGLFGVLPASRALAATCTSSSSGNWSTLSWSGCTPGSGDDVVIANGHTVTLNTDVTVRGVTINSGGTFNNGSKTLTAANGYLTNNGAFTGNTGSYSFTAGGGVYGSSTTTFNNVTIAAGVDFKDGSNPTAVVNGTLTINSGGYVNNDPPSYGSSSTLKYNSGGSYGRNLEWSATSGPGYPANVQISNNTTFDLSANGAASRQLSGNLTIDSGSTFGMGSMNTPNHLTVLGDVLINGALNLSLGTANIYVGGNWTSPSSGTFANNGSYVYFNGGDSQVISGAPSGNTRRFERIIVQNNSTVTFNNNVGVENGLEVGVGSTFQYGGSANFEQEIADAGPLDCDGACTFNNLTVRAIDASGSSGVIDVNGDFLINNASSNFKAPGSGVSFTVGGNFTNNITSGSFTANGGAITLDGSGSQTLSGATVFHSLTINNSSGSSAGVILGANQTVNGVLTLTSGLLKVAGFNLTLDSAASISGVATSANMVVTDTDGSATGDGFLCKSYAGDGSFTFPVGDAFGTAEYSPATLAFSSGLSNPSTVCARVTDAQHPNWPGAQYPSYITRYWTATSTDNSFTGTASFTYVDADVVLGSGQTESALFHKIWDGSTWTTGNQANTGTNTISSPVSSFSDHTAFSGSPLAVTLADFYAEQVADHVRVAWETVSELDNRGFNLYRGTSPDGWDRQLNATLIPSQSQGNPGGFVYTWDDYADLVSGTTYYYWLEDVAISGATTLHGPVSVEFTAPTAVTLDGVTASPAAGAAALPWLWVAVAAGAALALGRRR